MPAKALRVRQDVWSRARKLAPRLAQNDEVRFALGGVVNEHDVLRIAIEQGLAVLEEKHREGPE